MASLPEIGRGSVGFVVTPRGQSSEVESRIDVKLVVLCSRRSTGGRRSELEEIEARSDWRLVVGALRSSFRRNLGEIAKRRGEYVEAAGALGRVWRLRSPLVRSRRHCPPREGKLAGNDLLQGKKMTRKFGRVLRKQ
ncbi:4-hydroxy-3-methylbut-2-enyl diphosphatereductase [Striga asiatica]|uniref:4-hydroxy-3-methylbut-2-enyl diphosphatereductase n=1 Tax=Striga asiatica TaxID=4170 RepID=A0A5A7Q173_STRAF|nr:4-hydroxy-3-methylbut-2-enyl diphosphatereductase [Striga asiatica]